MPSIGDKIFDYTRLEIERKTDSFIRARPFLKATPPIRAELILDRMPDVSRIEVMPLLAQRFRVEAMVLAPTFMHRSLTIVVDQQVMDLRDGSRYNMALAEEIGHIELHRAVMLDIQEVDDFVELQRHHKWFRAEQDAKYYARALLMPGTLLENVAADVYEQVATDVGFSDLFHFAQLFVAHIATSFEIPRIDAQKRIDSYVGDIQRRLERSVATRSTKLLSADFNVKPTEVRLF